MVGYAGKVLALSSDKNQPTTIDSNKMTYDDKKNVNVFSGNVLLTRGTLVVTGNKLTLTQKEDGTQFAVVEGEPARFQQQRDSEPTQTLFIKGRASRIDIDGAKEIVTLTNNANIQKLDGKAITEEISGKVIVYEQLTEYLTVQGSNKASGGSGRVQAVIQPRSASPPPSATTNGAERQ